MQNAFHKGVPQGGEAGLIDGLDRRAFADAEVGGLHFVIGQQGGVKGQLDVFGVFHAALGAVQAFGFVVQQQAPGGLAGGAVDAVDTVNSALQGDGAEGGGGIFFAALVVMALLFMLRQPVQAKSRFLTGLFLA